MRLSLKFNHDISLHEVARYSQTSVDVIQNESTRTKTRGKYKKLIFIKREN